MPNDTLDYLSDKTEHDLQVILHGFRMCLADAELFDTLAEQLDLSDECMAAIRDDVQKFLDDEI